MLDTLKAILTGLLTCHVFGRVTGLGDFASLVFDRPNFRCDADVRGGRYSVRLKPGRYVVSYRVFNNFTRAICDIEVLRSGERDIHYDVPRMTVKVHNLPAGTQGGMVYLRHSNGSYTGREVERFAEFELDFRDEPDLFVDSFGELGIKVGGSEHRFPFKTQIRGTLDIDFAESQR